MHTIKGRIFGVLMSAVLLVSLLPFHAIAETLPPDIITITIQYIKNDADQTILADPYIASVPKGYQEHKTISSPHIEGYAPDRSSVALDFSTFNQDETIKVVYNPLPVTYTVHHLLETLDGQLVPTQDTTHTASVGSTVVPTPQEFEGFHPEFPLPHATAPQDNSLELNVIYRRNHYQLSYDTNGGTYIPAQRLYYGSPIERPQNPVRPGYSFAGWDVEVPSTMPARDVVLHAQWSEEEQTPYRMNVYVQDLNNLDSYSFVGSTIRYGKTGSTVVLPEDPAEYPQVAFPELPLPWIQNGWLPVAYKLNAEHTKPELTKTISGDGKTVLNVYFDRREFTIKVGNNPSDLNNPHAWFPEFTRDGVLYNRDNPYSFKVRFGQAMRPFIPVTSDITNLDPNYSIQNNLLMVGVRGSSGRYERVSWMSDPDYIFNFRPMVLMNFNNEPETRYLSLERQKNNDTYTLSVHTFVEPLNASRPDTFIEESTWTRSFEYSSWYYTAPIRNGFTLINTSTHDPDNGPTPSTYNYIYTGVERRSDAYVKVYYKRNSYPIRLFWDPSNAALNEVNAAQPVAHIPFEKPLKEIAQLRETEGKRPDSISSDFVFAGWYYDPELTRPVNLSNDIMQAAQLDLFAKWAPADSVLQVTFDPQNGDTPYTVPVNYGEKVSRPETPLKPGYIFVGWKELTTTRSALPQLFDFERNITKHTTLTAVWKAQDLSEATILYVQEDGTTERETISQLPVGSTYIATARVIEGKLPHTIHQSHVIQPDPAKNIITFTYRPFTSISYEIRYEQQLPDGTIKTLAPHKTIVTQKAIDTQNYQDIPGYIPLSLQRTLQMSANEADNVMTFLYRDAQESSYKLEVYFDDGNGQLRQDDTLTEIVSARIGTDVVYNARLTIDNYQLDPTRSQLSGRVTSDQLVLKAVYVLGLERPVVDPIEEGDSSIKVGQPDAADKVIITIPDPAGNGATHTITINKQTDGTWKTDTGVEVPVLEGKIIVPVDPAWMVPGAVIEVMLGKDGLLSEPTQVVVQAKQQAITTPQNNVPGKKLPKAGDASWIAPVVAAFAAAGITLGAMRIRSKKRD